MLAPVCGQLPPGFGRRTLSPGSINFCESTFLINTIIRNGIDLGTELIHLKCDYIVPIFEIMMHIILHCESVGVLSHLVKNHKDRTENRLLLKSQEITLLMSFLLLLKMV